MPAVAGNDPANGQSCVRYIHISEIPDQYSIGIFVFSPHSCIPLHDHPEMCVLSRLLYGDLRRVSLDLAQEKDEKIFLDFDFSREEDQANNSFRGASRGQIGSLLRRLPKGSRAALKNDVEHLQAPDVTSLYPYEGNLHEFVAGPHGAAVLDVLLPPYDNSQNRDCTFYTIQDLAYSVSKTFDKKPCFIVPTGQPENFHCISGRYRDLGENEIND